ncbi:MULTISPECIES: DivIVA domain-containing protein [unclassified Microbacterium]|uniref:DivIVA domain-containing protein n=1 Tax=unclassified Microbacterium TaxID=2609290 RepID=UPI001E4F07BD|nr:MULTISPECIES: DivIVA domain-containing protein [unclassified Microbacterium]
MTDPTTPAEPDASVDVADMAAAGADQTETRGTSSLFPEAPRRVLGYDKAAVDAFLERARQEFEGEPSPDGTPYLDAASVRTAAFPLVKRGYAIEPVDAALARIEDAFAARDREAAVATTGTRVWVERARDDAQVLLDHLSRPRRRRFARAGWLRFGYRTDEVDLVADRLVEYFETGRPITVDQVRAVAFRMQRRGYQEEQVDALLDAVIDVMLAVR